MIVRPVYPEEKNQFNNLASHPLQSWAWGKFREKTGLKVIRIGQFDKKNLKKGLQLTIHPLPKTNYQVGYLPKCSPLNQQLIEALVKVGQENNCLFIKTEPNQTSDQQFYLENGCLAGRPLFTKYTFQIDLTKDKKTLLANMKQKTRYNVRLAEKRGVRVSEDNSRQAFEEYLKLMFKTTRRQNFYAHDEKYHRLMWQTLYPAGIARLLKATYQGKTLASWILFVFNNVLYYPYGASSREHKKVMASNKIMWEAMLFGKKLGCQTFDLWGCLGPDPDPQDPWYGFHRFKEGYGAKLVEFIGTFDLVLNHPLYRLYKVANGLRWKYLRLKTKLSRLF